MVAWYPFNHNLDDSTANNNDMMPIFVNGGLNYIDGNNGAALSFAQNGNCDYTRADNLTGLNNQSFTIAGWFFLRDSVNATPVNLAVGRNAISNFPTFSLEYFYNAPNGSVQFYTYYDFTYTNYQTSSFDITPSLNQWHHLAFSYEGGDSIKAYMDGAFLAPYSFATNSDTLNDVTSRMDFGATNTYCNKSGSQDDFMIYNRALSRTEVAQIYAATETTGLNAEQPFTFTVYPNPASDIIFIQPLENQTIDRVDILNLEGKQVMSSTTNCHTLSIQLLDAGMYLLRCWINDIPYTQRIIKN
jgi:hypothetical protein